MFITASAFGSFAAGKVVREDREGGWRVTGAADAADHAPPMSNGENCWTGRPARRRCLPDQPDTDDQPSADDVDEPRYRQHEECVSCRRLDPIAKAACRSVSPRSRLMGSINRPDMFAFMNSTSSVSPKNTTPYQAAAGRASWPGVPRGSAAGHGISAV